MNDSCGNRSVDKTFFLLATHELDVGMVPSV